MSDITSFITGLSNGINGYMQANQQQARSQQNEAYQQQLSQQTHAVDAQTDQGLEGKVSPDMAEGMIPGSGKWVNQFQQTNGRLPTISEVQTGLNSVMEKLDAMNNKQSNQDDKESQLQDKLEKQAQDRLTSVRGDQSLMRAEAQRDAAGLAYDTIAKAQSEGRDLSQVEYTDLLGQLWKVRTGSSPTEQVLKDIDQKTAKEGFNRAMTYFSGNPNLVGATTTDTLNNIKQFVDSSGNKADQQWSAYMKPRLIKPTGLDDDRWGHVLQATRGLSYAEQKAVSDKSYPAKPAAQPDFSGFKIIKRS